MPNTKKLYLKKKLIWFFLLFATVIDAKSFASSQSETPPKQGNFAISGSQQPGPFLSFGQNILDKGQTQINLSANDAIGVGQHYFDVTPAYLHQMTDATSILLSLPISVSYKSDQDHSSGFKDAVIQLEHVTYTKNTSQFTDQATIVFNVTVPTGSATKNPPTGFDRESVFLGFTLNRTAVDWYGFISDGLVLPNSYHGTKFGNIFLYQFGLGKNIKTIDSSLIIDGLVEVDGNYTQKNKIRGSIDNDSGGNIVFVTPSIWLSSKTFIFQTGIGFPVVQHFFGKQKNMDYLVALSLIWTC